MKVAILKTIITANHPAILEDIYPLITLYNDYYLAYNCGDDCVKTYENHVKTMWL